MGSYLLYDATIVEDNQQTPSEEIRNFVYFDNSYRNQSADGIYEFVRYDIAFRYTIQLCFSLLSVCLSVRPFVCLSVNVALHNNGEC